MRVQGLRGLIFDKDGTLIDFHATWSVFAARSIAEYAGEDVSVAQRLADVWGFDLTTQSFDDASPVIAGSNREVAELAGSVLPDWDVDDLERRMADSAAKAPVQAITPLAPVLGALRAAGMRLAVMTNDAEMAARAHMKMLQVADQFDAIMGSDSGHGAKPSGAPLLACAQQMGCAPQTVAMVGDSTHDLISGRDAGMQTVAVLTGTAKHAELAPYADVVVDSIADLPGLITGP